jgi:hypothetical protein
MGGASSVGARHTPRAFDGVFRAQIAMERQIGGIASLYCAGCLWQCEES